MPDNLGYILVSNHGIGPFWAIRRLCSVGLSIPKQETTTLLFLEEPLLVILCRDNFQILEVLLSKTSKNILVRPRKARADEVQVQSLVFGDLLHRLQQLLVRLRNCCAVREVLGPFGSEDPP